MILVKKIRWKSFFLSYTFAAAILCLSSAVFLSLSVGSYLRVASLASALPQQEAPVIILDAGHGGEDGGTSSAEGLLEKDVNLAITRRLEEFLTLAGFEVILTREEDVSIGDGELSTVKERKASDLKARLEYMKQYPDAVFVSIHQNHFDEAKYAGTQIFYSQGHTDSQLLAQSIQDRVVGLLQKENTRQCKPAEQSIYLLWNAQIPAVIVECGFLSNPEEAAKLQQEEYQAQMAFAISCGILDYHQQITQKQAGQADTQP